jgi:addiction module HigA family antidote
MAKRTISSPSSVLKKLMEEYGLNASKLAAAVNYNQATLRLIILGKGKITCPIALRLAKFFGDTPEYWLNLQNQYDISEAAKDKELSAILKGIKKASKTAAAKKETKKTASKKQAASEKTAGTAGKKAKAAAGAKKSVKKSADKKPADAAKPAGAKRGRKPKAAAPDPIPQETPVFPETAPEVPDVFSDFPGTEGAEE